MNIFEALKAGKSLRNPATWKKRQMTAMLIGTLLTFVVSILPLFGIELPMDEATVKTVINPLADGLATALFVFSFFITPATTEKISGLGREKIKGD